MEDSTELIILLAYVVVNIVVLGMYAWDKHKAKSGKWRTPEKTLLIAALFGPWGAAIGMRLAHHKTRKVKFKLVYVFLILHIVIIAYLLYEGYL